MPRAVDLKQPIANYDPTRSGTEFHLGSFQQIDELIAQILAGAVESFKNLIIPAIEEFTGLDLSMLTTLLDELDLDFSTPEAFVSSIVGAVLALPEILVTLGAALIESGVGLLGGDSPLNALNLFNLIPTDLMAQISASNIGTAATNLITDPDFLDPTPIEGWLHDPTGGYGGTGSRTVTADGTTKELLGNLIPVSEGQVLPISGRAKWSGLAGSGEPVAIGVTGYMPGGATVQATVDSHNTTPPTTDWVALVGTYTVPANMESLRTRLIVASTATAGTVSFSTMNATKVGPMLQRLIAGTDLGEFLPDDITNLFTGIISNTLELVNKAALGDFNDLVSTIAGDLGDDIEAAGERLAQMLDFSSPLDADNINSGNIADVFVPGLGSINDNIVTRLLGISGSGFTHTEAADALAHTTFAAVDTSARLAQLENVLSGGVSDSDDFERTSSTSLGAGWLTYYQGGAGVWATPNGHDASWAPSGVNDRDFLAIRNAGQIRSATDLQRSTLIIGTAATRFASLIGLYNFCGHNDIWLRISDATTGFANVTGIRYRFGADGSASICRFVNGVNLDAATALAYLPTDTLIPPGPGTSIWAEAGIPGSLRHFRAGLGTSTLLQATEVGTASGLGGAYRRWGHGGRGEGSVLPLPGQQRPGSVHQETRKDQLT